MDGPVLTDLHLVLDPYRVVEGGLGESHADGSGRVESGPVRVQEQQSVSDGLWNKMESFVQKRCFKFRFSSSGAGPQLGPDSDRTRFARVLMGPA